MIKFDKNNKFNNTNIPLYLNWLSFYEGSVLVTAIWEKWGIFIYKDTNLTQSYLIKIFDKNELKLYIKILIKYNIFFKFF